MATHIRRLAVAGLALGLSAAAPRPAAAQDDTAVVTTTTRTEEKESRGFPWGLLGLLGLAGLMPRGRKDVHVREELHTRPAPTRVEHVDPAPTRIERTDPPPPRV
ncbi:MAG TPA: WGxxGxxG family protein [Longimicrobium sp.]|uniref:WGxxGxxG family protein n=1 Tax=Longimicrobium sp. TaxID=2029185 RepID=UPI002ED7CFB6